MKDEKVRQRRITQKMLMSFIDEVAEKKPSDIPNDKEMCYYSKIDGSYFTREGMEKDGFKFLLRLGITEQLQNSQNISGHTVNIGYNPQQEKWYGWSHRALYGFGIGSKVKKGDAGYGSKNEDDFLDSCLLFWKDKDHREIKGEFVDDGVRVSWVFGENTPNEKIRGNIGEAFLDFPSKWGKGEWEAKTLDDAKQMAIDFAEGVG